ncbi:hypothetical protein Sjap_006721 [Stephania japonica]|uniref:Uncharacterized protein n=1 Tax=Stephania japonica TaxID=461633 RepID=A0AAP0K6C7_9MAGN
MDFLSPSNAVDVSACFLVEASGDSEKDMAADCVKAIEEDSATARAEDDAESCCSDGLNGYNGYVESGGDGNEDEECFEGNDHHGEDEDEDGEHENDFGSDILEDQSWDDMESMQSEVNKDERSRVESIHGEYLVSEDEKNKVFWDTCLAVGYP